MSQMKVSELASIVNSMHKDVLLRSVDQKVAERYAQLMLDGVKFPPILVGKYPASEKYGDVAIVDGIHRIIAAQAAKIEELPVKIESYTSLPQMLADMYVANQEHGLPVSDGERNKRIELLRKQGWKLADIAKAFHLSTASIDRIVKGSQGEGKSGPKGANKSAGQKTAEPKKPKALLTMMQKLNTEFARKRPNTIADFCAYLTPATDTETEGELDEELFSVVDELYGWLATIRKEVNS